MAQVVNMPRLSDTMEEGVVAKWLKQVGDRVEEGDILAEIETDKATMEFESFHEGTLLHIGIAEGDGAPVDSLLAIIGEKGEDISALLNSEVAADEPVAPEAAVQEEEASSQPSVIPDGVEVVTMPRLSDTMEEGTVATWLKDKGDKVEEGEILAEIETDKATMEFESFYSGTLLYIGIEEGGTAPVDDVLAIIGPEGTDVEAVLASLKGGGAKASADATPANLESTTSKEAATASLSTATGNKRVFASPLAKKMASDKGIDLAKVTGSGENGRIIKKDIERYTPVNEAPAAVAATPEAQPAKVETSVSKPVEIYTPVGEEQFEESKNSQMRKTIAKRLGESKFTAPHYYLDIEVDMDNAIASRQQINAMPETKISFNDLVLKASAMALRKHPQVNSQWHGDITKIAKHIHLGVAVAVDDGLVVPVLKFADQQSLMQLGQNVKTMAVKARDKKLQPAEMEGSTFTVSNLGMFGITEFTSIINQPNSAILSVGAIVEKPVVKNGEIVVGNTMKLTLACDHRTVDGATGAKFLQTLKTYIENPVTMLA